MLQTKKMTAHAVIFLYLLIFTYSENSPVISIPLDYPCRRNAVCLYDGFLSFFNILSPLQLS